MAEEYTCRLKVKPKEGEKDLNEHMTLAYLGNTKKMFDMIPFDSFPRTCTIAGEDMLGPNKETAVWLVKFETENEEHTCFSFWKLFNVKQEHTGDTPIFHVTKKGGENHRNIGDKLTFVNFSAKRVGPFDPYYEVTF